MSGKLILKHSGCTLVLQYKNDRLISKSLDNDNSIILNLIYEKDEDEIMRYFYSRGKTSTLKEVVEAVNENNYQIATDDMNIYWDKE